MPERELPALYPRPVAAWRGSELGVDAAPGLKDAGKALGKRLRRDGHLHFHGALSAAEAAAYRPHVVQVRGGRAAITTGIPR